MKPQYTYHLDSLLSNFWYPYFIYLSCPILLNYFKINLKYSFISPPYMSVSISVYFLNYNAITILNKTKNLDFIQIPHLFLTIFFFFFFFPTLGSKPGPNIIFEGYNL